MVTDISGFHEKFAAVLEKIGLPEIDRIESILENSKYEIFCRGERATSFIHREFKYGAPCVFVSCPVEALSEVVKIKLRSEVAGKGIFLASAVCAAALIVMMLDGTLPRNAIVNFQRDDAWCPYDFPSRSLFEFSRRSPEAFDGLEFVITLGFSKTSGGGGSYVVQNPGCFTFKPKPPRIKIKKERAGGYGPGLVDFIRRTLKDGEVTSEKLYLGDSDLICWPMANDLYSFIFAVNAKADSEIAPAGGGNGNRAYVVDVETVADYSEAFLKLVNGIFTSF